MPRKPPFPRSVPFSRGVRSPTATPKRNGARDRLMRDPAPTRPNRLSLAKRFRQDGDGDRLSRIRIEVALRLHRNHKHRIGVDIHHPLLEIERATPQLSQAELVCRLAANDVNEPPF